MLFPLINIFSLPLEAAQLWPPPLHSLEVRLYIRSTANPYQTRDVDLSGQQGGEPVPHVSEALAMHGFVCVAVAEIIVLLCTPSSQPCCPVVGFSRGCIDAAVSFLSSFTHSSPGPSHRDPCLSMAQYVRNCWTDGQ